MSIEILISHDDVSQANNLNKSICNVLVQLMNKADGPKLRKELIQELYGNDIDDLASISEPGKTSTYKTCLYVLTNAGYNVAVLDIVIPAAIRGDAVIEWMYNSLYGAFSSCDAPADADLFKYNNNVTVAANGGGFYKVLCFYLKGAIILGGN